MLLAYVVLFMALYVLAGHITRALAKKVRVTRENHPADIWLWPILLLFSLIEAPIERRKTKALSTKPSYIFLNMVGALMIKHPEKWTISRYTYSGTNRWAHDKYKVEIIAGKANLEVQSEGHLLPTEFPLDNRQAELLLEYCKKSLKLYRDFKANEEEYNKEMQAINYIEEML